MSIEEILKAKVARLDSVPNEYYDSIDTFQKRVYKELIKLFDELTIKGGQIELSKQNLITSAKIVEKLRQMMSGKEYADIVFSFIKEFDTQAKMSNSFFTKAFGEITDAEILKILLDKNKQDTLLLLSGSSIDANFITPIKSTIDKAIITRSSLSETIESISTIALGNKDIDGKLLSYSKQIAFDAFAFNDRAYTKTTSDTFGIVWYRYAGGTILDTRCFCEQRNGKYFHKSEIADWGNKKDIGICNEGGTWQGMYKNTNASNIFTVLGGYNCRHDLVPVSAKSVPKDVLLRNIKSGYFKPTDKEKELLGL